MARALVRVAGRPEDLRSTLLPCDAHAVVPKELLEKYGLQLGNAIMAEEKHLALYQARGAGRVGRAAACGV